MDYLVQTVDSQGVKYGCGKLEYTKTGFTYNISIAYVIGVESGHSPNIVIPKTIKAAKSSYDKSLVEYNVTVIDNWSFDGCYSLKSIIIPDSIKEIRMNAFEGCQSLTSIVIPDSVIKIGSEAFDECKNLEYVKLSKNLEHIGEDAFRHCSRLKKVIFQGRYSSQCYRELKEAVPSIITIKVVS